MECWEQASIKVIRFKATFIVLLVTKMCCELKVKSCSVLSKQGFIGGPAAARRPCKQTSVPLLAYSLPGSSLFFNWGEGGGVSRGRPERWLRWFAHPHDGLVCRGHTDPSFAPNTLFLLLALQKR